MDKTVTTPCTKCGDDYILIESAGVSPYVCEKCQSKTTPPSFTELVNIVDRLASCVERIASSSVDEEARATQIAIDAGELKVRNDSEAEDAFFRMGWNNCIYELGRVRPELKECLYEHRQEKSNAAI
jgi:hypothetical protein